MLQEQRIKELCAHNLARQEKSKCKAHIVMCNAHPRSKTILFCISDRTRICFLISVTNVVISKATSLTVTVNSFGFSFSLLDFPREQNIFNKGCPQCLISCSKDFQMSLQQDGEKRDRLQYVLTVHV